MDKQTIVRDIKHEIGNWPNKSQIARYLGKSREYVSTLMYGVEGIQDGKSIKYLASDVAQKIMEQR